MRPEQLTSPPTADHPATRTVKSFHSLPSGGAGMAPLAQFTWAVRLYYWNYFKTYGRATRAEFWWVALFHACVLYSAKLANWLLSLGGPHAVTKKTPALVVAVVTTVGMFPTVWQAVNLIPSITLLSRRFHDTDSSAALLLTLLIPVAGWVITIIYGLTPSNPRGTRFDVPQKVNSGE